MLRAFEQTSVLLYENYHIQPVPKSKGTGMVQQQTDRVHPSHEPRRFIL